MSSGYPSPNRKSWREIEELHHRSTTPIREFAIDTTEAEEEPLLIKDKGSHDDLEQLRNLKPKPNPSTTYRMVKKKVTNYIAFIVIFLALFAVLLWDLRKTQSISHLIHDDHQALWQRMNDTSLQRWFSSYDLCLLTNSDQKVFTTTANDSDFTYKTDYKNCSKFILTSPTMKNRALLSSRLFCTIGSSLGKACPAPLASRKHFYYQLKDKIYHMNDESNARLIQSLKKLARAKIMLIFAGDGLSKQNFDALICEISRIEKNNVQILVPPEYANKHNDYFTNNVNEFTIQWKEMVAPGSKGKPPTSTTLSLTIRYYKILELFISNSPSYNFDFFDMDYLTKVSEYLEKLRRRKLNRTGEDSWDGLPRTMPSSREEGRRRRNSHRRQLQVKKNLPINNNGKEQRMNLSKNKTTVDRKVTTGAIMKPFSTTVNVSTTTNNNNSNRKNSSHSDSSAVANRATLTPKQTSLVFVNQSLSLQTLKGKINEVLNTSDYKGVFIIANVGVAYNSREKFRIELPSFLEWLNTLGQDKHHHNTIYYRETAAQHWNHSFNGYFDSSYRSEQQNNGSCVPLADSSPELDWRNIDIVNMIEKEKYRNIRIIPFHELTMPLYDMHASSERFQDCTHYCYLPQMWQPIWYEIYNATKNMKY